MELGAEFKALLPVSGEEDIGKPVPEIIHHLIFFVFVSQALPEYCSLLQEKAKKEVISYTNDP